MKPDPVTIGVVRELLISIVREMRVNLSRSAFSSIITEGHDYSCALLSAQGEVVAQSEDNPAHIFPLPESWRGVVSRYGQSIGPGDVYIVNDPYVGGTHLNDVAIYAPRADPSSLHLFPAIRAHWADVGGAVAGSISGQSTHVFQEGVRIPPLRLMADGAFNEELCELLFANVRDPDERRGDLMAMLGTANVAARRLDDLEKRYGRETIALVTRALLDRAEARVREVIRSWPAGTYRYENYLDNSGSGSEPMLVCLRVTVQDDGIECDFTGTTPQVAGPINGSWANTATGCFIVLKSFLDPGAPVNSGHFRPTRVHVPKGSFLNAEFPAPAGGAGEIRRTIEATMAGCMAQIVPSRCFGDVKGGANHCYVAGRRNAGAGDFLLYEYASGGSGAIAGRDGENFIRAYNEGDFNSVLPIETLEATFPLVVEHSELRASSGGPGQWRGGLGLERRIRVEAPSASLSVLTDRVVIPPYGVCGGGAGAANRFTVARGGEEIEPSPIPGKATSFPLRNGDVVVVRSAGGGGYGDPLRRDPQAVLDDIVNGLVTAEAAHDDYGVVLRDGRVDAAATTAERKRQSLQRTQRRAWILGGDRYVGSRHLVAVSAATAAALGVERGQAVELLRPDGAPLRAFVDIDNGTSDADVGIGPIAAGIVGAVAGTPVTLRAIRSPYRHPAPDAEAVR